MIIKIKPNSVRFLIFSIFAVFLTLPSVFAAPRSGVGILDAPIQLISNIFNIRILSENPLAQEGFLKFALFMVLFSLSFWSLRKVFDSDGKNPQGKRTAMVISFAFSMIGIFMMPTQWFNGTGGILAAILTSVVFMAFFFGLAYVAVAKLNNGLLQNFFGLMILIALISMLGILSTAVGIPISVPEIPAIP